jgi:CubicO group peptidase (beta-lactamase class C family)
MSASISAAVEAEVHGDAPGVAIALINRGEVVQTITRGLANLEWNIPIRSNTIFRIGSITKQFTAVAIMMLFEDGRLSVDDPIGKFLPDISPTLASILIRQLLSHTSGVANYTDLPEYISKSRNTATPNEIGALFENLPLDFEPGSAYRYSNSGYLLLGRILETVTEQSYENYLRDHIFRPLSMHQTSYLNVAPIVHGRASGYSTNSDGIYNASFLSMTWPYAAGALGSSITDLALWHAALRDNRLISQQTLSMMHTPAMLLDGSSCGYGFGWMVGSVYERRCVHHAGGINGFSSYMAWFPDDDAAIILLSNLGGFPLLKVVEPILRLFWATPSIPLPP